ncbi:MAG: condensation domain-containing protein, partial [Rhodocyclaceae bacterium]
VRRDVGHADAGQVLSPEQQALLMRRLKQKKAERAGQDGAADAHAAIPRAPRDQPLPLSFAQQRLWFLAQLEPDNPFYNIPMALRLRGTLDCAVLQRVLDEVVRRHEALRTTFSRVDGLPWQVVHEAVGVPIALNDLSAMPADEARARADELVLAASRQAFDLAHDLPLRVGLIRLGEREHVVTFTLHHIVADGWSAGVLIREVATLYTAFQQGQAAALAPLPLQYADFAAWQRGRLTGSALETQLAFWKDRLAGAPALLELPTDHPRPAVQGHRGRRHRFALGTALAGQLRQSSRSHGVTLYMTLLSAFNVLLMRYSGQTDICVGTAIANRNRAEIEPLIGFFVNTLVMRGDLSGDPTFATLLRRTEAFAKAAYSHQDVPFEHIVEALSPARSLSHSALIQVYFVLEPPAQPLRLPGLEIDKVGGDNHTAQFDLTLQLNDDDMLSGEFHYSSELFEPATLARLEVHFKTLLQAVVDDAATPIGALPLLPPGALAVQLAPWNATDAAYPPACVHDLFEAQARATPDALAVVYGDRAVDYRRLDAWADRLASSLRARGIGAESLVGVCCARSLDRVVAVLGILKAGAAYLPLDPDYPAERLGQIIDEAVAHLIVADADGREALAAVAQRRSIDVCGVGDSDSAPPSTADKAARVTPANLAYVLYTSGSTGRPKGVAMPHGALCNLLRWQTAPATRQGGRCLHLTSLNFDVSFQEIFATLVSGGTLLIAPADLRGDMARLADFIVAQRVERLFAPYVVLQHLAEALTERDLSTCALREIITAGEQLKIAGALPALFAALPQCALANQYGPTEAHVVTECLLPADRAAWPLLPSIGRPIANLRMHVLDARLRPLPVGVPGELYIAGAGLARG